MKSILSTFLESGKGFFKFNFIYLKKENTVKEKNK